MKVKKIYASILIFALLLCGCGSTKPDVKIVTVGENQKENMKMASSSLPTEWYGWWKMDNTSGEWKNMHGYWWDCCMQLSPSGDDAEMLIWDEDLDKDNYLAKLNVNIKNGAISFTGGEMMDISLPANDCKISLSSDSNDGESCLTISGTYKGEHKGKFDYTMYLKPWGAEWFGEELPYYYKDWYLPLVEAGKPMPDKIGN